MDPRQPQNAASRPDQGYYLDEATRASFQHADHTSTFHLHGRSAYNPDSWTTYQDSTLDPAQGLASIEDFNQTWTGPQYAPAELLPDISSGDQNLYIDPALLEAPAQSPYPPSMRPNNARTTFTPPASNGRPSPAVDAIQEQDSVQGAAQTMMYPSDASTIPTTGPSNYYRGSTMPAQPRPSIQSPRQTSTCPIYAPEVLIPATGYGRENWEIDATHRNYVHGPVASAQPSGTYLSQGMAADLDVPRQEVFQPENHHAVSRPPVPDYTNVPRAGPLQQGSESSTEQARQPLAHNRPSSQFAGAAAENPIELDLDEDEDDTDSEHITTRRWSPPVRTLPRLQQAHRAFNGQREHSPIVSELNTSRSRTQSPQQIPHQASRSNGGPGNLNARLVEWVAQQDAQTGQVNRRKRSRNAFEHDEDYTPAVAGASYGPSSFGNRPPLASNFEGFDSLDDFDDDDDEDVDVDEEDYEDFSSRQAPPKRRRLGNGRVAPDRPTHPVNEHGGQARPTYPNEDWDDTYSAASPINDGTGPQRRPYPGHDFAGPSSGFHGAPQGGRQGTLPNASVPAITGPSRSAIGPSMGARPIGRRGRANHGELRQDPDGQIWFQEHGSQEWEPTRYHDDARAEMIHDMAQIGQYGETSGGRQPERGPGGPLDITSFNPPQYRWFFTSNTGNVQWDESQNPYLYRYERRGLQNPDYEPGPLRFRGSVILNDRDQPMTDRRHLPLTISSEISGAWMENIQRIDSRISVNEIQDRMPRSRIILRTAMTNRMGRFRASNGLASWNSRDGTERIKAIMRRNLTAAQIANNSTEGYDGLTKEELAEIFKENEKSGKYNKRAGKNAKR